VPGEVVIKNETCNITLVIDARRLGRVTPDQIETYESSVGRADKPMNVAEAVVIKTRDGTVGVDTHGSSVSRAAGIKPGDTAIGISQEPVKATAAVLIQARDYPR